MIVIMLTKMIIVMMMIMRIVGNDHCGDNIDDCGDNSVEDDDE